MTPPDMTDQLNQLRQKILDLQEGEEYMLKCIYGNRWELMKGTPPGSGYEICVELLKTIDDIQKQFDQKPMNIIFGPNGGAD